MGFFGSTAFPTALRTISVSLFHRSSIGLRLSGRTDIFSRTPRFSRSHLARLFFLFCGVRAGWSSLLSWESFVSFGPVNPIIFSVGSRQRFSLSSFVSYRILRLPSVTLRIFIHFSFFVWSFSWVRAEPLCFVRVT
jgi:hypothetical protein